MKLLDLITAIAGVLIAVLVAAGVLYFAFRKKKPKESLPK